MTDGSPDIPNPSLPSVEATAKLPETWTWVSLDQLTTLVTSGSRGWKDYYSADGALYERRSKNRPRSAARAGLRGGVKGVHRRRLVLLEVALIGGPVEHRRDVQGGAIRAGSASGSGGWGESADGGAGLWDLTQVGPEDGGVFRAAGISEAAASEAAEARPVGWGDRRDS